MSIEGYRKYRDGMNFVARIVDDARYAHELDWHLALQARELHPDYRRSEPFGPLTYIGAGEEPSDAMLAEWLQQKHPRMTLDIAEAHEEEEEIRACNEGLIPIYE